MIRKLLHGLLAATILWLWFAMLMFLWAPWPTLLIPPVQAGPNDYIPPPGALRTYQGDFINIDLTGCNSSANGELFNYRFQPISGSRPIDTQIAMTGIVAACPAGQNFANAQIPLQDGWLIAAMLTENSSGVDAGNEWIQAFVGRGTAQSSSALNFVPSVNNGPIYLFTCSPAQFQQCSWFLGQGMLMQDDTLLGQNLGANYNWQIANPAAGSQIVATAFPGQGTAKMRINVIGVTYTLQTSAVAGSRYANVQLTAPSAGPIWMTESCAVAQPPSSTVTYQFAIATGPGTPALVAGVNNPVVNCALPGLVQIVDASTINTAITNFDPTVSTGDKITNFTVRTQWVNYRD